MLLRMPANQLRGSKKLWLITLSLMGKKRNIFAIDDERYTKPVHIKRIATAKDIWMMMLKGFLLPKI